MTSSMAPVVTLPGHPAAWVGNGVANRLRDVLAGLSGHRLLVVHGRGSYQASGAGDVVAAAAGSYELAHIGDVRPNPDVVQVEAAVAAARRFRPDVVVGIGGGSSLDMAKCVAVLAAQPAPVRDCLADPACVRIPRQSRLVLIPTTAGSGSELTRFATVYWDGRKMSLDRDQLRADAVLVDPALSSSLPLTESVAGGLDALGHAIESYWSVAATAASRELAWQALRRLVPAVTRAAERSRFDDAEVRTALAHGAALAGAAIDVTRTTAAHALSYSLTSRLGIRHGAAVGLHLRWLLQRHSCLDDQDCRHPDGAAVVRRRTARVAALAAAHGAGHLPDLIARLLALAGQPTEVRDLALPVQPWLGVFVEALGSDRAANNPARLRDADLRTLLI